jgi:hypothetical protein
MDSRTVVYELKRVLDYIQHVPDEPIHRVEKIVNYMEYIHQELLQLKQSYRDKDSSIMDMLFWRFESFYVYSEGAGFTGLI